MATEEIELQRLVVRMLGENTDAIKKLTEVKNAVGDVADDVEKKQKSAWEKAAGYAKGFADKTRFALGAVKGATDLLKGKFDTLGEGIGKIGDMAQMIPGPWGQAAGAILGVLGQIVDFINGPLIQAQKGAREGFMSVATGAQHVEKAMAGIASKVITGQLEKAVEHIQLGEQMRGGFGIAGLEHMENFFQASARADIDRIPRMIQQQQEMMQRYLHSAQFLPARQQLAELQIGGEMLDRPVEMQMRMMQRQQMRAMHAPARGPEEQARAERQVQQDTQRLAIMRYRRMVGQEFVTDAQAELILRNQIQAATEATVEEMRRLRSERIEQDLAHQTTQHVDKMRELVDTTVRLRSEAAGASSAEVKMMEAQQKIERELLILRERGATLQEVTQRRGQLEQENFLQQFISSLQEANRITQQNHDPVERYEQSLERLNRAFGSGGLSLMNYNRELMRIQNELQQASPNYQAFLREVNAGNSIVERFQDPAIQMERQMEQLNAWLGMNTDRFEDYAIAVQGLRDQYDRLNQSMNGIQGTARNSAEAFARINAQMDRPRTVEMPANFPGLQAARNDFRGMSQGGITNLGALSSVMGGANVGATAGRQQDEANRSAAQTILNVLREGMQGARVGGPGIEQLEQQTGFLAQIVQIMQRRIGAGLEAAEFNP